MTDVPREGRLYRQLPAFWRVRDAEEGWPLRALLAAIEEQVTAVEDDIARLYDGLFVETADPWILPYIGDLVGTTPLFDVSAVPEPPTWRALFGDLAGAAPLPGEPSRLMPTIAARTRPDIAKTIYYRRRKGTAPMLEELARDVTGWPAHVVEFFKILGWTQWLRNHVRHGRGGWVDLRSTRVAELVQGAFDDTTRTVDVRPFDAFVGRHGIPKIGFLLWRLVAQPLDGLDARVADEPWRWRFSPLGQDAPLFTRARREADETGQATELHVPAPIRHGLLFADLAAARAATAATSELYGPFGTSAIAAAGETSLHVALAQPDGSSLEVPAHRIRCMTLDPWRRPSSDLVGIDAQLGRIALGDDLSAAGIRVACCLGAVAGIGGGPYARTGWLTRRTAEMALYTVGEGGAATLRDALASWGADGKPDAVIRILDNRSYHETSSGSALEIEPADPDPTTGKRGILAIEAADHARPHLRLDTPLAVLGDHPESMVTLGGLLIEGAIAVTGTLRRLRLLHCTLVPGLTIAETGPTWQPPAAPVAPSLTVVDTFGGAVANTGLSVECAFSITGPLRMPAHARQLVVLDGVVDGVNTTAIAGMDSDADAPPLVVERSTVFGAIRAARLPMMDTTIATGLVRIERRDDGCVRFSYVPPGSRTPRRVRCQPDLAEAEAITEAEQAAGGALPQSAREATAAVARRRMQPVFTTLRYGQPGYAQLGRTCPAGIAAGAEDGSAMGMTCHLKEPQRLANLRRRLDEYLPLGLEPGIVFVT
ncbi:hypothetical protein [Elioraea sp.]|uniref:hypothetical protein n=1 Tax=Elioraea sp. TaxID=2185103 RepID=UPI0021DECC46|nr:hypothetical protein [Elioraea sp.]GIX11329.1 MAG: hypothetical protein KatS3mg116_3039 [Elioraea sp.]